MWGLLAQVGLAFERIAAGDQTALHCTLEAASAELDALCDALAIGFSPHLPADSGANGPKQVSRPVADESSGGLAGRPGRRRLSFARRALAGNSAARAVLDRRSRAKIRALTCASLHGRDVRSTSQTHLRSCPPRTAAQATASYVDPPPITSHSRASCTPTARPRRVGDVTCQ